MAREHVGEGSRSEAPRRMERVDLLRGVLGVAFERVSGSTLMRASYATSEVELRANGFTSWDRGFDASGRQVWGATAGPHQFVRRTPVEP